MKRRLLLFLLTGIAFFNPLFFSGAWATDTYVWIGGYSNNWEDEENWRNMDTQTNGELPVEDSDIMIDGNVTVYLSSDITTESIQLSGGATLIINAGGSVATTEGGLSGSNSIRLDAVSPYPLITDPPGPNPLYLPYLTGTGPSALTVHGTLDLDSDDANGSGLYITAGTSVTVSTTGSVFITNTGDGDPAEAIRVRGGGSLTNNGVITVTNPGTAGIKTSGGGQQYLIVNNGTLTITGGDLGMDLGDTYVENNGTLIVSVPSNNKILDGDGNFRNFGTFGGNGVVSVKKDFFPQPGSIISPGTSVGTLTFDDNLDLSEVTLLMEINAAGSYDQIIVEGTVDISSATLSLSGTYTPVSGDNFPIVQSTTDEVDGNFGGGPFVLNGVSMVVDITTNGAIEFGSALPVELTSFTAIPEGKTAHLSWATATETNNDYFSIEHSTDGRYFSEVGRVRGAGTSQEAHHYDFVHGLPGKGLNYYRLDQHDLDGAHEYSKVQAVLIKGDKSWTIRPALARDVLTVEWPEMPGGNSTVEAFDMAGRKVYGREAPAQSASLQIPVADWAPGLYWLVVKDRGGVSAQRFVKE